MQGMENCVWTLRLLIFLVSVFLKAPYGNNAIIIDGGG